MKNFWLDRIKERKKKEKQVVHAKQIWQLVQLFKNSRKLGKGP